MTIFSNSAFLGEHLLITGATGGIGSALAKTAAALGATVTLTGRNEEKLSELQAELRESFGEKKVHSFKADLSLEEERLALVEFAEKQAGEITMLVNNAGLYHYSRVDQLLEEDLNRIMHVNFTSAVLLTQLVYKGMLQEKRGSIVNVASLSGLRGNPGNTAYVASKFALVGFTHCLALEAIQHGIRVNAVCPGYVDTEMGERVIDETAKDQAKSYNDHYAQVEKGIPSGRISTPQEVANSIIFLLSNATGNIVGETLKISGGALLR